MGKETAIKEVSRRGFEWAWSGVWLLLIPIGTLALPLPAHVEKSLETTLSPRISLVNVSGRVVVKGWDRPQVHIIADTSSPKIEIDMEPMPEEGAAEKIHFTTHVLDSSASGKEKAADYTLEVPLGASVQIRNPEGSVEVGLVQGDVSVESVGATVKIDDVAGHLSVRSLAGDIEINRPAGRVEATSVCGSLHFVSPSALQVHGSTTTGKIVYEGDFLPGGEYVFDDYSGDMDVLTYPSDSFELRARTQRGKAVLEPGLVLTPKRHTSFGITAGNALMGSHNAGRATVELTSFSGTIHIRRRP